MGVSIETLRNSFSDGIQIRGDVLLSFAERALTLSFKKKFTLNGLSKCDENFIKQLKEGLSFELLEPYLTESRKNRLVEFFLYHGVFKSWIRPQHQVGMLDRQAEWVSHFCRQPEEVASSLAQKTVVLVGCGGTGAVIAMHLARSGIKHFILIDGGTVDMPDLNRQLAYFPADLGRTKTAVLSEHLREIDAEIKVVSFQKKIESDQCLFQILKSEKPSLIINCADTPIGLIHAWVAEAARSFSVPALFGGVGLGVATIGPLLISEQAKLQYAVDVRRAHELLRTESNILKASVCFTNSIAAVMIAFEAFKYLADISTVSVTNKAMRYDFFEQRHVVEKDWNQLKEGSHDYAAVGM